jgi:hypothetical protein
MVMDEENNFKEMTQDTLEMLIKVSSQVPEFLLQDLKPDTQRLEIEEVARVVVTPIGVEVYTFDDKIYFIEIGGTRIKKMKWASNSDGDPKLEEECNQVMTVKK